MLSRVVRRATEFLPRLGHLSAIRAWTGFRAATPDGMPLIGPWPPLPGLHVAFARAHDVDPSRSILVGTGPAHRTLATTLGARYAGV